MILTRNKSLAAFGVGIVSLLAVLLFFFCSPSTSYAASLGSEEPYIYFTYEEEGVEADGNSLENRTFDVSIWVQGVEQISTLQVTANLDDTVTVASEPSALMSDEIADVLSMGYVINNDDIVIGFISDNTDYSVINSEATLIATLSMTFAEAGDAADHIKVTTNPNLTFIQTNYNDGLDDSYALVQEFEGYQGVLYPMTADVSPELKGEGHSVTGSLVIMTDGNGNTDGIAVSGEYTVTVYSDEGRTQELMSVVSTEQVGENNLKTNSFVIDGLADGTYYLSISSKYAITRKDITLIVNGADIVADAIPMMACDFDRSTTISAGDASTVYENAAGAQNAYCDLDGSGTVSAGDASIVYACAAGGTIKSITIK